MKYLVHPQGIFTLKIGDRLRHREKGHPDATLVAVFFSFSISPW